MGKKSAPPAPDYAAAAEKTAAGNLALTNSQTSANRPTQITPWGRSDWTKTPGTDNWQQNITLSPQQQQALDEQMAVQRKLSAGAGTLADNATRSFQAPANEWDSLPALGSGSEWRQKAQDAVTQLQQPYLDRRRSMSDAQLSNQGITRGSEAWRDQQMQLGDEEARANLAAIGSGRQEADMLFGQNMQGRQQGISEMMMRRSQPLNELNALLHGQQVGSPQMPQFQSATKSAAPDYLGAADAQYQGQLDAFNAKQAGIGGITSGLFGLGSAALGNPLGLSGLFKLG